MDRDETERKINIHAWKDPAFKKKLLSDPYAALKEFGMKNISNKLSIRVIEEHSNEWCITLCQPPPNAKNLSEEELKKIAAARCSFCACGP